LPFHQAALKAPGRKTFVTGGLRPGVFVFGCPERENAGFHCIGHNNYKKELQQKLNSGTSNEPAYLTLTRCQKEKITIKLKMNDCISEK